MDPISLTVVALFAGGSVAFGSFMYRKQVKQVAEAWGQAAERIGGRFEPAGGGMWRRTPAKVIATMPPGVEVVVDHYTVSTGKTSTTYTRLTATAAGMPGDLELSAHGILARVREVFGAEDIQLGDPPFDERFFVRAKNAALVRAWLGDEERRSLLVPAKEYSFRLRDGKVVAQRIGYELQPAVLAVAMYAVGALAGAGKSLLERWRTVAATLGGTLAGETFAPERLRFSGEHEGRPIIVEATTEGIRVIRPLGATLHFELAAGAPLSSLPEAPRLFPSSGAEARWAAIQPARFACDGETATLSWDGYLPDVARVTEAATLLADLEADAGPYR